MIIDNNLPPENKGFIYGLYYENKLFYIGQTKKSLKQRYNKHISKSELYENRYTKKSKFIVDLLINSKLPIIELIDTVDLKDLDFYEIFYIEYFKSLGIELTNGTSGGDGCDWTGKKHTPESKILMKLNHPLRKPVGQFTLNGILIKTFDSLHNAETETGILRKHIASVCKNKPKYKTAGGFLWKYLDKDFYNPDLVLKKPIKTEKFLDDFFNMSNIKQVKIFKPKKIIIQYDLEGNIINKFEGLTQAMNLSGIHHHLINQHCTSEKRYFKAKSKIDGIFYTFRYENQPFDYHEWDKVQKHQKKLIRYSLDGIPLDKWNSAIEVSKFLKSKDYKINTTLNKNGEYRINRGFIILSENEIFDINKIPKILKGKSMIVTKLDDSMNIIETYNSIKLTERINDIRNGGLNSFLRRNSNQSKKYHGFYWKLIN